MLRWSPRGDRLKAELQNGRAGGGAAWGGVLLFPVFVGEVEVLGPVVGVDVVFAGAEVVADVVADGGVGGGLGWGGEAGFAVEGEDGFGV